MKNLKTKIVLEREVRELEQHDYFDDEEIYKKYYKYSQSIGEFLITFSELEMSLNRMIIKSISDRSDEEGLRIIKYLEFKDKISLAGDQYRRLVSIIGNN